MLATIGYEKASLADFIATLKSNDIEVLIDIRDRAQSRRKGFSKTALSEAANAAGIEYVHFRTLGDPKEGREAAKAGRIEEFKTIFSNVLASDPAQQALLEVENLAKDKRICMMCYERDHLFCHRKMVSDELEKKLGCETKHLGVWENGTIGSKERRVLHTRESVAASV
ncbi:MAG: DUF488 domain-containing protein [Rhizobiaceae bacterium]|nr:DUF488 domain-containing protein [Rhizobiaceae bacterium]